MVKVARDKKPEKTKKRKKKEGGGPFFCSYDGMCQNLKDTYDIDVNKYIGYIK